VTKKVSSSKLLQKIAEDNESLKNEITLLKESIDKQKFERHRNSPRTRQNINSKNNGVIETTQIIEHSISEASKEKIIAIISEKSRRIMELEAMLKEKESDISEILLQKESEKMQIIKNNKEISTLKSDIACLHSDKMKLKQIMDSLQLELQKLKGKDDFHSKILEEKNADIQNQKAQFDALFAKNIDELNEKDNQIQALKLDMDKLHSDKMKLKQDANQFVLETRRQKGKESDHIAEMAKKLEEKELEIKKDKIHFEETVSKNIEELNEKNSLIKSLNLQITKLHTDRIKLKEELSAASFEERNVLQKRKNFTKQLEEKEQEIKNQKTYFDNLFSKNIDDLKEKDTKLLMQGQEIISLKNTINELSLNNNNLQKTTSSQKEAYNQLKNQIQAINKLFVSKNGEVKTIVENLQKEIDKYKKIAEELKINNQELILDINKYSMQVKMYKQKIDERDNIEAKKQEGRQLDVVGKEQLSIHVYNQNKEIELLKQTILELTHKLKTRQIDEAKMIDVKNKEIEEKITGLTQEHSKKEIELEYKLEDLRKENQALKSDIESQKQKSQQMLESIKNQFNTLL